MERLLTQLDAGPVGGRRRRRMATEARRTVLVGGITLVVFVTLAAPTLRQELAPLLTLASPGAGVDTGSHPGYRFSQTQLGSRAPVTYDSCRPLMVVLNPDGGPEGASTWVKAAVARVSQVSGLELRYDGYSRMREHWGYQRYQHWPPVLITFATPHEVPELKGDVAGIGGSIAVAVGGGPWRHYVEGTVTLDAAEFRTMQHLPHGRVDQRAILMHELGHVLGLAHVKDPHELMYSHNTGQTNFGPGDRRGLRILGHGRCFS